MFYESNCCPITGWAIDPQKKRMPYRTNLSSISRTTEYRSWQELRRRGYEVCQEWETDFQRFLKDMGKKPTSFHMLSRLDSSKMYCKENCYWKSKR